MDRGAWQKTVHGVARVRHNLAIKDKREMLRSNRTFLKNYSSCRQPDYSFDVSVQMISYINKIMFLFYFVSLITTKSLMLNLIITASDCRTLHFA